MARHVMLTPAAILFRRPLVSATHRRDTGGVSPLASAALAAGRTTHRGKCVVVTLTASTVRTLAAGRLPALRAVGGGIRL